MNSYGDKWIRKADLDLRSAEHLTGVNPLQTEDPKRHIITAVTQNLRRALTNSLSSKIFLSLVAFRGTQF